MRTANTGKAIVPETSLSHLDNQAQNEFMKILQQEEWALNGNFYDAHIVVELQRIRQEFQKLFADASPSLKEFDKISLWLSCFQKPPIWLNEVEKQMLTYLLNARQELSEKIRHLWIVETQTAMALKNTQSEVRGTIQIQ